MLFICKFVISSTSLKWQGFTLVLFSFEQVAYLRFYFMLLVISSFFPVLRFNPLLVYRNQCSINLPTKLPIKLIKLQLSIVCLILAQGQLRILGGFSLKASWSL